ncbi:MAG: alpha/beta hydrolase [Rhodospirillaceae bacterium]|nr:alpha/beta hydrolase [Rhodospirillaceae bacterium]
MTLFRIALTALALAVVVRAHAQTPDVKWAIQMEERYVISPDIAYTKSGGVESKLDVYARNDGKPRPTLLYIHGGGWLPGFTKDMYPLAVNVFLQMGWNVINADYRSSDVALAPAAVQDCLCALKWIFHNAKQYGFDTKQIVVMGHSAGGHLALTTGMIPPVSELNGPCTAGDLLNPIKEPVRVAAIVNWFGITDVADMAQGAPNEKPYAVMWLGSQANRSGIAKQASPVTYVRAGLPPIITVHGDKDPVVPFVQAQRLHEHLNKVNAVNKLVPIPGGGHGFFGAEATQKAYGEVFDFLSKAGLTVKPD